MSIYLIVTFISIICAVASQGRKTPITVNEHGNSFCYERTSNWLFYLSFLLMAGCCFLTKSGTDISNYIFYYKSWTIKDLSDFEFEFGAELLFIVLKRFIPNPYIGLGCVKVIALTLFYRCIYIQRKNINIGLAVLSYSVLLYIFNFHLLRMMIAVGFVFLAFTYEIYDKKKRCIICFVLAFLFHYTSIIPALSYLLYKLFGKRIDIKKAVCIAGVFVLISLLLEPLINYMILNVEMFSKYYVYQDNNANGLGIVQLILFVFTFVILALQYEHQKNNKHFGLYIIFGLMTFLLGSLGYKYSGVGRAVYYFYYFYIFWAPSFVLKKDRIYLRVSSKYKVVLSNLCFLVYLILQAIIIYYLNDSFKSNGLTEYILFWK